MQLDVPYYVTLTGSKNNAGDHLIKQRAFSLFQSLRPDRKIVDLNGWESLTSENLSLINGARCLILLGGPALQKYMRPNVYALTNDLSLLKVPIVTMGIGWHSHSGDWSHTHSYSLNNSSIELLQKIDKSGFLSSVRDYHTLNVLANKGLKNFVMTGCPALYSEEHFKIPVNIPRKMKRIAFSLGVSLKNSESMFKQMQDAVLSLGNAVGEFCNIEVVFHHSLNDSYIKSHGATKLLFRRQQKFAEWLQSRGISYIDISGSADKLINYYKDVDMHVGYRVHAHIFMNSISKPSILLCEDGRGIALKDVIGGGILKSFKWSVSGKLVSALSRLRVPFDDYLPEKGLLSDLEFMLNYELEHKVRLIEPRERINSLHGVMEKYLCQLP